MILLMGFSGDLMMHYNAAEDIILIIGAFLLYFMIMSMFWAITVETSRVNLLDYGENYHTHESHFWKPKGNHV